MGFNSGFKGLIPNDTEPLEFRYISTAFTLLQLRASLITNNSQIEQ